MGAKHTPTPWKKAEWRGDITNAAGELLATAYPMGDGGEEIAVINAELILRAVNSHDQLVSAVTACLKRLVADCADKSCVEIMEARAALTAAGVA